MGTAGSGGSLAVACVPMLTPLCTGAEALDTVTAGSASEALGGAAWAGVATSGAAPGVWTLATVGCTAVLGGSIR